MAVGPPEFAHSVFAWLPGVEFHSRQPMGPSVAKMTCFLPGDTVAQVLSCQVSASQGQLYFIGPSLIQWTFELEGTKAKVVLSFPLTSYKYYNYI